MQEVLEFVVYHLKQVGLDNKLLNGGIILTGGGSQLKHLIQLTEYVTGITARIGYPNEHLASGYIDELSKPMYATCIGLILKGYNDYENILRNRQEHLDSFRQHDGQDEETLSPEGKTEKARKDKARFRRVDVGPRKSLKEFMDSMKKGLIDLFKEEEDARF
jgi:cell division protein FtsA